MNVTCVFEKFQKAVQKAEKMSTKQASLPVLAGVLITAKENSLFIRSTNLHVGTEITLPAQVETEGVLAVDAGVLGRIAGTLKGDKNITLRESEGSLVLETSHTTMTLHTYSHEDFPVLPVVEKGVQLQLPVSDFLKGVESVIYSASRSDIKPEISSVYMYPDLNKGQLVFVATDSFRLSEKKVKVKNLPDFEGVLIPVKNLQEVVRLFGDEKNDIDILIGENQISISTESIYTTSRLVDGSFPDYQQIIPEEYSTKAVVLKDDLLQSLKIVTIFSDKYNQIDISVLPSERQMRLVSAHSNIGSTNTVIDASIEGDEIETRLNYTYITDALPSIEKDSIEIRCNGVSKPIILKGVKDESFLYLIMPMNR